MKKGDNKEIAKEAETFFTSNPPEEIDSSLDNKSEKEEEIFYEFTGRFTNFKEYLEHEKFIIEKLNSKLERTLREKNAEKAYFFSFKWAIFIAVLILLHGFGVTYKFFTLTQTEFIFIIGTLTASIFAFYTLVLKYLFDKKNND